MYDHWRRAVRVHLMAKCRHADTSDIVAFPMSVLFALRALYLYVTESWFKR